MGIFPAHMSGYHIHTLGPWMLKKGVRFFGTGVLSSCELTCGFLESDLRFPQEQHNS